MTPEIVDPWDVERTFAKAEAPNLADVAASANATAGPDNSPATVPAEESTPGFVMVAPDPFFSPPLAQRAAACANSTAFATAPKAKPVATSVVSAPSVETFASGAVGVAAELVNGAATPATFAESAASAWVTSTEFRDSDSGSPDLTDPVPADDPVPLLRGVKSSPVSAAPADVSDSPFCERSRALLSATSAACRTTAFDESASFNARANEAEEFPSMRAGWSDLKGTASGFDSLGTTVVMTQSR